jgi:hypothetical protein
MSTTTPVPDQMTEEEARRFIDSNTPRFNKLRENVVAIKTRSDEAHLKINELLELAEKKGLIPKKEGDAPRNVKECETVIQKLFDERRLSNGIRAKAWIQGIEACEAELATLSRAAQPGR